MYKKITISFYEHSEGEIKKILSEQHGAQIKVEGLATIELQKLCVIALDEGYFLHSLDNEPDKNGWTAYLSPL